MALQFIIGGSGTGKSYYGYEKIIREAESHPDVLYYVVVPEQFTMQTQKTVVNMSPSKGILNIDVVSFQRLAYRVLQEAGCGGAVLLDDTGKCLILRRLSSMLGDALPYLGRQMKSPGSLDEIKSLISEFMLYDVDSDMLETMEKSAGEKTLLSAKLRDMRRLYSAFREYLSGHYMTGEESMDRLAELLCGYQRLRGSVVLLDGFTGFTPVQVKVLRELLKTASDVYVTVTADAASFLPGKTAKDRLFFMSGVMILTLSSVAEDRGEDVYLRHSEKTRFHSAQALRFLEENLFRYRNRTYEEEQNNIRIFYGTGPVEETEETARRIKRLVRDEGIRYGEIAVITGNLEEYASIIRQEFSEADIPCFIDETHTVLMNPLVEFIRASLFMLDQRFSFESVVRYLRCGISSITREEADRLENYLRGLGIHGMDAWRERWVRVCHGMDPEEAVLLNELRERFLNETEQLYTEMSKGSRTVEEYCRILYEFIVRCRVQEKLKIQEERFHVLKDPAMEREYAQIYGIVMRLLDQMVEILGNERMEREEFTKLLETGLGSAKVALIPPGQDQVMVGDMERTRLKDVKALFFLGVNDGNIPKRTDSGGILTDMDREFFADAGIELAPDPRQQIDMQRFYLYLNLTKPQNYLTLSYVTANSKGEAAAPSYLVRTVQKLFPGIGVESTEKPGAGGNTGDILTPEAGLKVLIGLLGDRAYRRDDPLFGELYGWYLRNPGYRQSAVRLAKLSVMTRPGDHISREAARILYGTAAETNATRLELYAACAYAHFLRYALKLKERAEYELTPADLGNLVHQSLQSFSEEIRKQGGSWKSIPDKERDSLIDECLLRTAADYGNTILKSSSRNEAMVERARRILRRTVWALQKQLQNGSFEPEGFEVKYFGGRIDRIDVCEEDDRVFVKVIDYKTGNTSFDLLSVYHGLQLQLVVYMDGAMQTERKKHPGKEVVPAGIYYYPVSDPMISSTGTKTGRDLKDQILQRIMSGDAEAFHSDILDQEILKELKMSGLAPAEKDILERLDSTLASIPAALTKEGTLAKRGTSAADRTQFDALSLFVREKIRAFQRQILEGDASLTPYRMKDKTACTYCPYQAACGFDRKIPGCGYREIRKMSDDEIWTEIMKTADQEVE